jgi:demethylmenaquinone methyltransferase/2-methoxy-6-polyprenyl-1,4-benzoquinol methylase
MNVEALFNSKPGRMAWRLMAASIDNPVRRWLEKPEKSLRAAGLDLGLRVLEVGPGTGFYTLAASEMVGPAGLIYALDLHPVAIQRITELVDRAGLKNVEVRQANATATGLDPGGVDLVLLFGVIPSPTLPVKSLLPEMHRVLRPGGVMAVKTSMPFWSPRPIIRSGLFEYAVKTGGVHRFVKI